MNEGVGSVSILMVIVVFIAFASAYMAYQVNYTKAFRMKNKIIAMYEKYDANCGPSTLCAREIETYAEEIGYFSPRPSVIGFCDQDGVRPSNGLIDSSPGSSQSFSNPGYCVYRLKEEVPSAVGIVKDCTTEPGYYYRVVTSINIEIPVVQDWFPKFLIVTGDSKVFYSDLVSGCS